MMVVRSQYTSSGTQFKSSLHPWFIGFHHRERIQENATQDLPAAWIAFGDCLDPPFAKAVFPVRDEVEDQPHLPAKPADRAALSARVIQTASPEPMRTPVRFTSRRAALLGPWP